MAGHFSNQQDWKRDAGWKLDPWMYSDRFLPQKRGGSEYLEKIHCLRAQLPPSFREIYTMPISKWADPSGWSARAKSRSGGSNGGSYRGLPEHAISQMDEIWGSHLTKGENGSRIGGIGQVPKTRAARIADVEQLNAYIDEAIAAGQRQGVLPSNFVKPPPITVEDVLDGKLIAEFSLAPDSMTTFPDRNELLPIPHLSHQPMNPPTTRSKSIDRTAQGGELEGCREFLARQKSRKIQLRWSNLLTLFPTRWADSVVLDSKLHIQHEHFPLKKHMVVNSAEHDPSLEDLKMSEICGDMFTAILWLRSHWSCIAINHRRKRIRYLNSQLLDDNTALTQTAPFRKVFPDYSTITKKAAQQANGWDCGPYSSMNIFILCYYNEAELDRIKPEDATKYRKNMILQLILSFYLCPLAKRQQERR